jgi:hypothetical protein
VVKGGESYEIAFRARAPKETSISTALMQAHEPWKILGSANAKVGPEWTEVRVMVKASADDTNARLTLGGMGLTTGTFEFTGIALRTAGLEGSVTRDAQGRVPMLKKREFSRATRAKQRDWQQFIWDTESAYWNGMRDFLKTELGVKAPVVGTQGFWSPAHVQQGMDVIDSHAYWHHPDFHGKGWNQDVWDVKNESMAGAKDAGELTRLSTQRVSGKPFICTEYNHPAPSTFSAETFPLVLSTAALQDWDGVFAFSYCHRGDAWAQEAFNNYFDIDRHSVKMATLPAAAISFRRGDFRPLPEERAGAANAAALDRVLNGGPAAANPVAKDRSSATLASVRASYFVAKDADQLPAQIRRPFSALKWDETARRVACSEQAYGAEIFKTNPPQPVLDRSAFAVGRLEVGAVEGLGGIKVTAGETRQAWACYQFTVLDRDERASFATAKHLLITATGDTENTGMGWKNAEKTTVGRDWGKGPVLVEGPAAKIALPGGGKFKAWTLDERGQRRAEVPMTGATLELSPQHHTLWYEVVRE